MDCPKYIYRALAARARAADSFMRNDAIVADWLDKNGIEVESYHIRGGCESIVNPWSSFNSIYQTITNKEKVYTSESLDLFIGKWVKVIFYDGKGCVGALYDTKSYNESHPNVIIKNSYCVAGITGVISFSKSTVKSIQETKDV